MRNILSVRYGTFASHVCFSPLRRRSVSYKMSASEIYLIYLEININKCCEFMHLKCRKHFFVCLIFFSFSLSKLNTVFQAQPPTPPSAAQSATKTNEQSPFLHSVKRLVCNRNYILLLISYGMNVGVFYAISTLLNQVIEFKIKNYF